MPDLKIVSAKDGDNISFDEKRDVNVMKPKETPSKTMTKAEVTIKRQALKDGGYTIVAQKELSSGKKTWKSWKATKEISPEAGGVKGVIREVTFGIMVES